MAAPTAATPLTRRIAGEHEEVLVARSGKASARRPWRQPPLRRDWRSPPQPRRSPGCLGCHHWKSLPCFGSARVEPSPDPPTSPAAHCSHCPRRRSRARRASHPAFPAFRNHQASRPRSDRRAYPSIRFPLQFHRAAQRDACERITIVLRGIHAHEHVVGVAAHIGQGVNGSVASASLSPVRTSANNSPLRTSLPIFVKATA